MAYASNKTINGLEVETTIADTDELVFGDVSDTNRAKKITFANLKTEITGDDTDFVRKSLYDANSVLYATSDNTPVALTVGTNTVVGRVAGAITTLAIDSDLTAVSGSDDTVPSAKATKTALDLKANDADVVHDTGNETIAGVKTFSSDPLIPDEAYDATAWNGVLEPPTKNAVRDKFESLTSLSIDEVPSTSVSARTYWTSQLHIDADLGWTLSATTINNKSNGVNYDQNTTTSVYSAMSGDSNSSDDIKWDSGIDLKLAYWFIPSNTSSGSTPAGAGDKWYFHGFSTGGGSATQLPDITLATEERVGFSHYNGKIYTLSCNGTNITSTEVDATDDGVVKKIYQINFTPSSTTFYINSTLVATHTAHIPTSSNQMTISYFGYDGSGGGSGFTVSHPILSETIS